MLLLSQQATTHSASRILACRPSWPRVIIIWRPGWALATAPAWYGGVGNNMEVTCGRRHRILDQALPAAGASVVGVAYCPDPGAEAAAPWGRRGGTDASADTTETSTRRSRSRQPASSLHGQIEETIVVPQLKVVAPG